MNIAFLCAGLLSALLVLLSIAVSLTRLRQQRGFGMEADSTRWMAKIGRAQGNASEYIPLLVVLIFFLELEGAPFWMNWVYGAAVVVRYCHALGMLLSRDLNQPHPLRFIGSLGTYVVGALLSGMVIFLAFWGFP